MGTGVSDKIFANLSREILGSKETLDSDIDSMEMPFESELSSFAEVSDEDLADTITGIKTVLASLKDLNVLTYTMLMNPTNYGDTYAATFMSGLTTTLLEIIGNADEMSDYVKDPEENLILAPETQHDDTTQWVIETNLQTDPAHYNEDYTAEKDAVSTEPVTLSDKYERTLTKRLDPDDHDDTYAPTIAITLLPSLFSDQYEHTLDTLINTYVEADGTGLSASVEEAIFRRARARILKEANRISRRIITETSKRLPYSGMLADLLMEADEDTVIAMADVNNKILEEQARLAYQSQIDRINQAIAFEKDLMSNFHQTEDRLMKAYIAYDDIQLRKDANAIQNFHQEKDRILKAFIAYDDTLIREDSNDIAIHENWKQRLIKAYVSYDELGIKLDELKDAIHENNLNRKMKANISFDELQMKLDSLNLDNTERFKDRQLKAYMAFDDIQLKQYAASIDFANLVYQNRRDAINSALQMEGLLMKHYGDSEDRQFKADTVYEEMLIKNHWAYYETLIRQYLQYVQGAVEFIKSAAYNPDQLTFNNWLEMSKIMADGQLRIAAMVSNLMPSGQSL